MNERNKPTSETLNAMRDEAYSHAVAAGFHADSHTQDHYFCLVITELMEAVEADRNDRRCTFNLDQIYDVEDDAAFYTIFQAKIKDSLTRPSDCLTMPGMSERKSTRSARKFTPSVHLPIWHTPWLTFYSALTMYPSTLL